jgi:hypothetical protein
MQLNGGRQYVNQSMDIETKNPTDLLRYQVMLLDEVNGLLLELQQQQAQTNRAIAELYRTMSAHRQSQVRVVDVKMPFSSVFSLAMKWMLAGALISLVVMALVFFAWLLLLGAIPVMLSM